MIFFIDLTTHFLFLNLQQEVIIVFLIEDVSMHVYIK